MFAAGVVAFGVTSLMCAVAPSIEFLIAARALQGVAGALLVPSTLALIIATFPENERGAAIGSWTAWAGISTVIGPLGGGSLIDNASWRWIFAINVIPSAITLWLIARAVPKPARTGSGRARRLPRRPPVRARAGRHDLRADRAAALRLGDPPCGRPASAASCASCCSSLHERRTPQPMLPLQLFRDRNFAVGNVTTLAMYAGLGGMMFLLGIYVQQVGGYSATAAGATFLPITALMFALSRRFGALADRYGPRAFMTVGPIIAGCGMLLMLRVDADADYLDRAAARAARLRDRTGADGRAADRRGARSRRRRALGRRVGINNAVSRVAGLLAIAVLGAFVSAQFDSSLDAKLADRNLSAPSQAAVADGEGAAAGGRARRTTRRPQSARRSRPPRATRRSTPSGSASASARSSRSRAADRRGVGIRKPTLRGGRRGRGLPAGGQPLYGAPECSGEWQTASTLIPSGSSAKAP